MSGRDRPSEGGHFTGCGNTVAPSGGFAFLCNLLVDVKRWDCFFFSFLLFSGGGVGRGVGGRGSCVCLRKTLTFLLLPFRQRCVYNSLKCFGVLSIMNRYARTHTHAHTHARAHTRTHTYTHARTHAHTHTHKPARCAHEKDRTRGEPLRKPKDQFLADLLRDSAFVSPWNQGLFGPHPYNAPCLERAAISY